MRCIVGEEQEEGRFLFCPFTDIFDRPIREYIGRMTRGVDAVLIQAHIVLAESSFVGIVVHHILQPTVKKIKAFIVRKIGGFEAEVPLANERSMIARLFEHGRHQLGGRIEVTPVVLGVGADQSGYTHTVRVAARHQ